MTGGTSRRSFEVDAARFDTDVVAGLEEFSHLCVVFVFHLVDEADIVTGPGIPEVTRRGQRSACSPSGPRCGPTGWA